MGYGFRTALSYISPPNGLSKQPEHKIPIRISRLTTAVRSLISDYDTTPTTLNIDLRWAAHNVFTHPSFGDTVTFSSVVGRGDV